MGNCRESSRPPGSPPGDRGTNAAVQGDAHRSVSIDPTNYSVKTKAPREYISYQLACKMLPSTLHAPAWLWLHHRTHDSPARASLLGTSDQQEPANLTQSDLCYDQPGCEGCHPEPASPSSSCGAAQSLAMVELLLQTDPKPGLGTF